MIRPEDGLTYFVKPFELVCTVLEHNVPVSNHVLGCKACSESEMSFLECLITLIFAMKKKANSKILVGRSVLYFSQLLTKFTRSDNGPGGQIFARAYGQVCHLRPRLLTRLSQKMTIFEANTHLCTKM